MAEKQLKYIILGGGVAAADKAQVELERIRPKNSKSIRRLLNLLKALQKKKQSSSSEVEALFSLLDAGDVLCNALQDIQRLTWENQNMITITDVSAILEKVGESFKLASEKINAVMEDINVRGIKYDRKMKRMKWFELFIKYSIDFIHVVLTILGTSMPEYGGALTITGLVIQKLGEFMITFLENKIKKTEDKKKKIKKLEETIIETQLDLKFVPELESSVGMVKVESLETLLVQLVELKPAMEKVVAGVLELVSL